MIQYLQNSNLYIDTEDDNLMESLRAGSSGISDPELRGGWMQGGNLNGLAARTGLDSETMEFNNLDLDKERKNARLYFHFNFLISGALEMVHSFVIGDKFTYGDIHDEQVRDILEDFWIANDFQTLAERFFMEFLVDGENATVFPTGKTNKKQPALIGFPDVVNGLTPTINKFTRKFETLKFNDIDTTFTPDNCIWTSHRSYWNSFRGAPVIMPALDPAVAYIELLNHRIRVHELQGRLNAVYKAFVDFSKTPKDAMQQQQAKAAIFGRIPRHGGIITLAKNVKTGDSEEMDFLQSGKGAGDGEKDAKILALGVATALGIPLTWVWTGDSANRASADSMTEPAKRTLGKRQGQLRVWLDKVLRMEVIRRLGKGYAVKTITRKSSDDGLTSVVTNTTIPIERYFFPWSFPSLEMRDLAQTIAKVNISSRLNLASPQTLSAELGYDYSLELELLMAAGIDPKALAQQSKVTLP
jgi:hypothetical protein